MDLYIGDRIVYRSVYACKVRQIKSKNGALSAYVLIQLNDEETANTIFFLANDKSICYSGHTILMLSFMHKMQEVTLYFGGNNVFACLWKRENIYMDFGFGMRRVNFVSLCYLFAIFSSVLLKIMYFNIYDFTCYLITLI